MSQPRKAIAIWDVGKTNAKICALDAETGKVLEDRSQGFSALAGPPYLHLDTEGLWTWFKENIAELGERHRFGSIVATAHGATAALISDGALVLPVLDYEDTGPDEIEDEYSKFRPPFSETLSPPLPCGINYGRSLFWQSSAFPKEFAATDFIISYVQYWSWRMCGVAATECTTIGSHSDLWNPEGRKYSSLVGKLGWERLFPPIRRADEVLGKISAGLAKETGLPDDCQIYCGIHDSNASLLPWLVSRKPPFTVASTGTWVINLSVGASTEKMDPERDCASNVSMYGDPVATSRWMGGREYANITGGSSNTATVDDLMEVLDDERLILLPNQGGQAGPYQYNDDTPNEAIKDAPERLRLAAAALYCALMLDVTLDLCDTTGPTIVEGSFAKNDLLLGVVASLRHGDDLLASEDATGTTTGAARLVLPDLPSPSTRKVAPLLDQTRIVACKRRWLERISSC